MTKLDLTEVQRASFSEQMALSTDARGHEIVVGLSREESEWFVVYNHRIGERGRHEAFADRAEHERYWQLYEQHDRERRQVVLAANELQVDRPTRN